MKTIIHVNQHIIRANNKSEQLENMTLLEDIFEALDGIEKPNLADHKQAIGWIS